VSYWERSGASNEWYTPAWLFEALGCSFDLDVASPTLRRHVPVRCWLTERDDGLKYAPYWHGFVWMNAPFGGRNGLEPWLKAFAKHGDGVALTPDRTSAPWFQDAFRQMDAVLFTRKIRFERADGSEGISPSNGTALMAIGWKGVQALRRAAAAGVGILTYPERLYP